jgi:hypothetical protein
MDIEEKSETSTHRVGTLESADAEDEPGACSPQAAWRKPADAEEKSGASSQHPAGLKSVENVGKPEGRVHEPPTPMDIEEKPNTVFRPTAALKSAHSESKSKTGTVQAEKKSETGTLQAASLKSGDSEAKSETLSSNSTDAEVSRINHDSQVRQVTLPPSLSPPQTLTSPESSVFRKFPLHVVGLRK